tara:strand:+ start:2655 stop:2876 length:222 start_codon:yes stop_codon:yes gene_type:complete
MTFSSNEAIELLEKWGDSVDIFYTQFLEVSFFLKVSASENMAIAFVKKKLPMLSEQEIAYLITEVVLGYQETL